MTDQFCVTCGKTIDEKFFPDGEQCVYCCIRDVVEELTPELALEYYEKMSVE